MARMAAFTEQPSSDALGPLLEEFDADLNMLVVFNHPLWDMAGVGHEGILASNLDWSQVAAVFFESYDDLYRHFRAAWGITWR